MKILSGTSKFYFDLFILHYLYSEICLSEVNRNQIKNAYKFETKIIWGRIIKKINRLFMICSIWDRIKKETSQKLVELCRTLL